MKNGTHPLYTLLRDPKPIATNGSAKKHAFSLGKKILWGGLIAVALGVGIWQLGEYQVRERREQFITWVAKYRPTWGSSMIKAEWDKIQYARQHADIVAPEASAHAPLTLASATPIAIALPHQWDASGSAYGKAGTIGHQLKPVDIPGGYWVESDNPQIGWHWIKGSPSKSGRFTDK